MSDYFGKQVKPLGFGCMRLPMLDQHTIDVEQVKEMVDCFMGAGFSYFDTAWAYEGSEEAIGEALVKRYPRESFQLVTKLAAWAGPTTKEEAEKQLADSLERTGAGYFDSYLLHNLGGWKTHFYDDYDLWNFVKRKKEEGVLRHVGFSFHSTPDELDEILTAHPEVDFVQLQINYADWESSAIQSRACYEIVRKHGKQIVVMEPVKGGMLAKPPVEISELFHAYDQSMSVPSWAIRYAASLEGVMMVLSGMSTLAQVEDNVSYMKDFKPLDEKETDVVRKAQEIVTKLTTIPCTACKYCEKVCPQNIGIPATFAAMNLLSLYNDLPFAKNHEFWQVVKRGKNRATECVGCGSCEKVCPQHIEIPKEIAKAAETLK